MSVGEDPRDYARLLSQVYDAAMSGAKMPARPRQVISDSWGRAADAGVDPESATSDAYVEGTELEFRRADSGLAVILEDLTHGLDSLIADGDNILVVADAEGRVLWRSGANRVLHRADRLGFVEGADWAEGSVGTNAIGTAISAGRAVQIFSAEHFVRSHHSWTCTGAPIRDPRTGSLLGAVDVSGPAASIHPTTVALVDTVAKLAESRLRDLHGRSLALLRAVAAPMLARTGRPAFAVDADGWVAALDAVTPRIRLSLPRSLIPGRVYITGVGECDAEPLPGGWLIRPVDDALSTAGTVIELDRSARERSQITVIGPTGTWVHRLSPRHADIIEILFRSPNGCSAAQMSQELFGSADRTVTVRAEISRLRKHLGGLLLANPYRLADAVQARLVS